MESDYVSKFKRKRQIDALRRSLIKWSIFLSIIASGIVALISIFFFITINDQWISSHVSEEISTNTIDSLSNDVRIIGSEIEVLRSSMSELYGLAHDSVNKSELTESLQALDVLEEKILNIEKSLSNDPTRLLEIARMRSDIDHQALMNEQTYEALRVDIERVYDMSKNALGLLFTLAFGLIINGITSFYRIKKLNTAED